MNWDRIELNWRKYRTRVSESWRELGDQDLDTIDGRRDRLAACLAARYGISWQEAEDRIETWRRSVRPPAD